MDALKDILVQIELHSPEGIERCFQKGVNPNSIYNKEPLIYELTSQYTRSSRFADCVKVFVDHGLEFKDQALLSALLGDSTFLKEELLKNPGLVQARYTLRSAYTPLFKVGLLHICAEFNQTACARVLLDFGADPNDEAGVDKNRFGGQTPIFHTVNQNSDQSAEMMDLLLQNQADLSFTVRGFIWGKGYDWETFIPSVNPISYAMMGLLPQMHREERKIHEVVKKLIWHRYEIDYELTNIPNNYLSKGN